MGHINEVNNDRLLRQVMAAEQPKPVMAVNKAWVKQHEDVFAVLRTPTNEIYIALNQAIKAKTQSEGSAKPGNASEQQRLPAYQKVIQKTACDAAPPLVYQYSKATSSNASSKDIQPSDITVCWQDKFLSTLREIPQRF